MQLVKNHSSRFVQEGETGPLIDMVNSQSDLGSFSSASPEAVPVSPGFKCFHFAGRCPSVSREATSTLAFPFSFWSEDRSFPPDFFGGFFSTFSFYAQRIMCWHCKMVCGRPMSHHGVWCDYVVFLSTFAGTGIADNSDTLLGASLTASLSLHWNWLSTWASWWHRAQGWVLPAMPWSTWVARLPPREPVTYF